METAVLEATDRQKTGTLASRRERSSGKIPGVLYGHKEETRTFVIDAEQFIELFRHGARMVELKIGGNTEQAIIKEVQYDHLGDTIVHVDFIRVSMTEKVAVSVEVVLHGTPAGTHEGGHLDQPIHQVTVECLPNRIPEKIDVNVVDLPLHGSISVADLQLPEGVTCPMAPDLKIAIVHEPRGVKPEEAEGAEAEELEEGSAEPEVIRQKKEEEEPDKKS